jgi:hypothetical protein
VDYPHPLLSDLRKYGVSGGVRWRGWPALEPALRVDWIRFAEGLGSGHAAIVASLWLRARV